MSEMADKLHQRGYPKADTQKQIEKTEPVPREALLKDKTKSDVTRIPFTTTYNRNLPPIQKIINKHWGTLQTSHDLAPTFGARPVVAYKRNKNLRNLIGQMHLSKMKKILAKKPPKMTGCAPCLSSAKNKCCRQIADSKTFKSEQTGATYEIRHKLNCKSKNIIYLGYCLKCARHQYVGKSEPPAHLRFNAPSRRDQRNWISF